MAGKSKIEWTDATWNPIRGCSRVSEGCRNCYAENIAARFNKPGQWGEGLAQIVTRPDGAKEARWTGKMEQAPEATLTAPLRWKKPRMIFVNSTSDLFHEDVPDEWIDRVFAVMALCPQHTFQVLTKRPERMREHMARLNPNGHHPAMDYAALMAATGSWSTPALDLRAWPLPNIWLGTSVEDQITADVRILKLLATPAAVRFVSAEPLLGSVDLSRLKVSEGSPIDEAFGPEINRIILTFDALRGAKSLGWRGLDWVICGGESGAGARPMHPDWARDLRDQCAAAEVPFFFKQWGEHSVVYDRDVDDPDWRRCDEVERKTRTGRWWNLAGGTGFHGDRVVRVVPTTKKAAGRLLDGVTHDGAPRNHLGPPTAGEAA